MFDQYVVTISVRFWAGWLVVQLGKQDKSTTCRRLESPQSLSRTSTYPIMATQMLRSRPGMIDSHACRSMSLGPPMHMVRVSQTVSLTMQGQIYGYGQRAMSHTWPRVQLICFFFSSRHSDQQFLRHIFFQNCPFKNVCQTHGWGQRSMLYG